MIFKMGKMELQHIDQVVEIEKNAFAAPWSRESFVTEVTNNHFAYYVVCGDESQNNQVVGYAGMWLIVDEAHITTIAVHSDYRGLKIGKQLLEYLLAVAKLRCAQKATLEVRPTNHPAKQLYLSLGFEVVGLRKGYYQDNGEDAIIMWKNL